MAGVFDRSERLLECVRSLEIAKGLTDRPFDELAALTGANPFVEFLDDTVVDAYVQSHGHSIAHGCR